MDHTPIAYATLLGITPERAPLVAQRIAADMAFIRAAGGTMTPVSHPWWAWSVGDHRIKMLCAAFGLTVQPPHSQPFALCAPADDPVAAATHILLTQPTRRGW